MTRTKACEQCGGAFGRHKELSNPSWEKQRYCSRSCAMIARHSASVTLAARLEAKLWPEPNCGCLLWAGSCTADGYGVIGNDGKTLRVHRVMFEKANGPIPDGMSVLHRCDTPACAEPDHLFLGTNHDNMRDAAEKGRTLKGERNPAAKLTDNHVKFIRGSALPATHIAEALGVSASAIDQVRYGKTWKHVT